MRCEGIRVIVCGGRDYADKDRAFDALDVIHEENTIFAIIHGNARGADTIAGMWAVSRGVRCWPVPAEWAKHGKSAGPKRNQAMLGMGVDMVVAFSGGRGTADMTKRAEKSGVPVRSIP